jgi:hypothetical protein
LIDSVSGQLVGNPETVSRIVAIVATHAPKQHAIFAKHNQPSRDFLESLPRLESQLVFPRLFWEVRRTSAQ